ncbi:hypothetical protein ACO1O0_001265 [Amphichorda felina]
MPSADKPKLGKLATPISATFPSEITSAASATPLSAIAFSIKPDPDYIKTPISPPSAYTDFLSKYMTLNSPLPPTGDTTPESASAPDTANSDRSDCSSKGDQSSPATSENGDKLPPPATAPLVPPSPYIPSAIPMSAPPTGPATFPSLKVPPSPSIANLDSPARSPFSARSVHSVFDWEAALKARTQSVKKKSSRTSVRHIREVVTRTVTYTPRMEPAPKGKRRKVE